MTGAESVGADPVLERRDDPAAGGSAEEEAGRFAARLSWPGSVIRALRAAPGPSWFGYLVSFAALALVGHGASWLGGAVEAGTLDPLVLVQASLPVGTVAWTEVLNAVALRSLRTLRPAMTVSDAQVRGLALELIETPRAWAVGAALAGVGFAVLSIVTGPENYRLGAGVGAVMWIWVLAYTAATGAIAAAATAHLIHHMRVVVRVHRDLVRIDLFRLDPLYSFANLTALEGIGAVAGVVYAVGALIVVGGVQFSLVELAAFGAIIPVAIAVFVVPLLGLHGRIQAEKERRRTEAGAALETAVAELHQRILAGDFERMSRLNDGLAAATSAHATISRISTWPWRPETLRGFASAIGLPVLLWLITAALDRLL